MCLLTLDLTQRLSKTQMKPNVALIKAACE